MIYITGEKETIESLLRDGGFPQSKDELMKLNSHLRSPLSPFTPVILPGNYTGAELRKLQDAVQTVKSFNESERKTLREMQQDSQDCLLLVAMDDLMEEFQKYAEQFTNFYNSPLINTPWTAFNGSLPHSSLIDIFAGVSAYGSRLNRPLVIQLDELYDHMMKRDSLNRELYLLKGSGGSRANPAITKLETEIAFHSKKIKALLPKKLDSKVRQYLGKQFTSDELRKMRMGSFSKKMASKGKLTTTNFDFLNNSGLARLRKTVKFLNSLGKYGSVTAKYLGPAVVGYDTYSTYKDRGLDPATRAFLSGTAGLAAGYAVGSLVGGTSTLGGLVIGGLAGDAALGGVLLICSPILGWVICGAIGLVVAGYIAYEASEFVGYLWDHRREIANEISTIYHSIETKILSIWRSCEGQFHELYNGK